MMTESEFEKAGQLVDKIGNLFTEENIEVAVVLSTLVSMLVSTAFNQTNMTGVELVRLFVQAVEKYEDAMKLKEIADEQADGRTTH
jgi:hypothetical protein